MTQPTYNRSRALLYSLFRHRWAYYLHPAGIVLAIVLALFVVVLQLHGERDPKIAILVCVGCYLTAWLHRSRQQLPELIAQLTVICAPGLRRVAPLCYWILCLAPLPILLFAAWAIEAPASWIWAVLLLCYGIGFSAGPLVLLALIFTLLLTANWISPKPLFELSLVAAVLLALRGLWLTWKSFHQCYLASDNMFLLHSGRLTLDSDEADEYTLLTSTASEAQAASINAKTDPFEFDLAINAPPTLVCLCKQKNQTLTYLMDRWLPLEKWRWRRVIALLLAPILVDQAAQLAFWLLDGTTGHFWLAFPLLVGLWVWQGSVESPAYLNEQNMISHWPIPDLATNLRSRLGLYLVDWFATCLLLVLGCLIGLLLASKTGSLSAWEYNLVWQMPLLLAWFTGTTAFLMGFQLARRGGNRWVMLLLTLLNVVLSVMALTVSWFLAPLLILLIPQLAIAWQGWRGPIHMPLMRQRAKASFQAS